MTAFNFILNPSAKNKLNARRRGNKEKLAAIARRLKKKRKGR